MQSLKKCRGRKKMLGLSTLSLTPQPLFSPIPKSTFTGIQIKQTCHLPLRKTTPSSSFSPVVMMSKRLDELKLIREMPTDKINEEVVELKGELFMLRLQKSTRNEFKSSEFRRMRKRIARMLTVKREREIEEGINKRISRKLDRQWKKSIVVKPVPSLIKLREEQAAEEAEKSA